MKLVWTHAEQNWWLRSQKRGTMDTAVARPQRKTATKEHYGKRAEERDVESRCQLRL